MPESQSRWQDFALASASPATKRCDSLRAVLFDVAQRANDLLSDNFRSVERTMALLIMPAPRRPCEALSVFVLFEELFRVDRRHAARSGGRNRLPVAMVLHIPRDEHARNIREASMLRNQISVRVHVQFALEHSAVRVMPDGHKNSIHFDVAGYAAFRIAQLHAADKSLRRRNLFDYIRR